MLTTRIVDAYSIRYEDVPVPGISDDQVLLKNRRLGVCASDSQVYHGLHQYVTFPLVMGHEVCSEIVEVGKNVQGFTVGDIVALQPQLVCGHCYPCRIGRHNVCESKKTIGIHCDGCACEYYAADEWNLHKAPDGLDPDVAALTEPLAVAVGSVKHGGDYSGANIVILGAGPIGNMTAQVAQTFGANKVLITDILDEKLEIAEKSGVEYTANTSGISLSEAIRHTFGSERKADIIIDYAATPASFGSILTAARNCSTIVITGNFKKNVDFDVTKLQRRDLKLVGHMMYTRDEFQQALDLLAEKKICYEHLITKHYALTEYDKAFQYIDNHPTTCMKVMIDIA